MRKWVEVLMGTFTMTGKVVFLVAALCTVCLVACSEKEVDYGMGGQEPDGGSEIAQFAEASGGAWRDSWNVEMLDGASVSINMNALVVIPGSVKQMSVAEVRRFVLNEGNKKALVRVILGEEAYSRDRAVVKSKLAEAEKDLAGSEDTLSYWERKGDDAEIAALREEVAEIRAEVERYSEIMKKAPGDSVPVADNYAGDYYVGTWNGVEYLIDFEETLTTGTISLYPRDSRPLAGQGQMEGEEANETGMQSEGVGGGTAVGDGGNGERGKGTTAGDGGNGERGKGTAAGDGGNGESRKGAAAGDGGNEESGESRKGAAAGDGGSEGKTGTTSRADAVAGAKEFLNQTGFSGMVVTDTVEVADGYRISFEAGMDGLSFPSFGTEHTGYISIDREGRKENHSFGRYSLDCRAEVEVNGDGVVRATWNNPIVVTSIVSGVKLLSFDNIKSMAKIGLEKYAAYVHNAKGFHLVFNRMELVYYRLSDPDDVHAFSYIPAWRLRNNQNHQIMFAVNAIDGSVLKDCWGEELNIEEERMLTN